MKGRTDRDKKAEGNLFNLHRPAVATLSVHLLVVLFPFLAAEAILEETELTALENDGLVRVCVSLVAEIARPVEVFVLTQDGIATGKNLLFRDTVGFILFFFLLQHLMTTMLQTFLLCLMRMTFQIEHHVLNLSLKVTP